MLLFKYDCVILLLACKHGMDVKTLSAVVGHVSAAIALDVYTHVTTEMQKNAALRAKERWQSA